MYNYLADYREVDKTMYILKINLLLLSILSDMLLLNLRLPNIELFQRKMGSLAFCFWHLKMYWTTYHHSDLSATNKVGGEGTRVSNVLETYYHDINLLIAQHDCNNLYRICWAWPYLLLRLNHSTASKGIYVLWKPVIYREI